MEKHHVVEYYCELIKEEPLSTLEPEMTADNTCVLESTSPFFGYYHDAPMGKPDPYIYCVLAEYYTLGEIIRATQRVNARRRNPVDVAIGKLYLKDKKCPVIRIKDINHFSQVQIIQQSFKKEGIAFKKRQRKISEQMGIIHLSKMLYLAPQGDGLFMDAEDRTKAYFAIPEYIDWEAFKSLTTEAKYDTRILYFDAAQAVIFENHKIIDLVRVFKENITVNQLRAIRDRYFHLIK